MTYDNKNRLTRKCQPVSHIDKYGRIHTNGYIYNLSMQIYIEYAIIDNLAFDGVIALLTLYILRMRARWWRVLLSAVFGTVFALLLPLADFTNWLLLPLKLLCGAFMVFFLYSYKSVRQYLKAAGVFLLVTLLMGGACFGIVLISERDLSKALSLSYKGGLPAGLIIAGLALTVIAAVRFIGWYQRFRSIRGFIYKIKISALGRSAEITAFLDSGNRVFDPVTNFPVVVVGIQAIRRMFDADILNGLIGGSDVGLRVRMLRIDTVGGEGKLMLFSPQKIEIYSGGGVNTLYDVMVGVSYKSFGGGDYEALLHPALLSA